MSSQHGARACTRPSRRTCALRDLPAPAVTSLVSPHAVVPRTQSWHTLTTATEASPRNRKIPCENP